MKKNSIFKFLTPLFFLLPALIVIITFQIFPIAYSFIMSFFDWDMINTAGPKFIGLKNYINLVLEPEFWHSLLVTSYYAGASVPIGMAFALLVAMFLNSKIKAIGFFRTI